MEAVTQLRVREPPALACTANPNIGDQGQASLALAHPAATSEGGEWPQAFGGRQTTKRKSKSSRKSKLNRASAVEADVQKTRPRERAAKQVEVATEVD